uniref:Uncharacterized protein n=1 Tax=Romanomermis culicivorax TaxID=13658 RepID=A0A915J271_ROMCU
MKIIFGSIFYVFTFWIAGFQCFKRNQDSEVRFKRQDQGQNTATGPPRPVQRALISIVGYKQIRGNLRALNRLITLSYNFRLRWYEPFQWNDGQGTNNDDRRQYELNCWVDAPGQESRAILNLRVSGTFTGYGEYLQFPNDMDVAMTCQIRPINALGLLGNWRRTNRVRINEVPIFLPGSLTDIRSLSDEDLLKIWDKANAAASSTHGEDTNEAAEVQPQDQNGQVPTQDQTQPGSAVIAELALDM